jgi:hypothetical protein
VSIVESIVQPFGRSTILPPSKAITQDWARCVVVNGTESRINSGSTWVELQWAAGLLAAVARRLYQDIISYALLLGVETISFSVVQSNNTHVSGNDVVCKLILIFFNHTPRLEAGADQL